ncbi:RHS repeat-associated core domain-containing protein [Mucilaginibacter mallensis]|uniref:RHS repeat-associated core domain-containing protein n=1 Tax=Mucilaginibacter mallensis TaxID=652787 RepID=A0A1H1ZU33_MUCMA|nr:RHS repeat-associated core domain-containing protein [Mucilaginibacter mallensis]SDT36912.1 RHS repeat-associated core domain-containing protein [Mucilaginibacter mallensis]
MKIIFYILFFLLAIDQVLAQNIIVNNANLDLQQLASRSTITSQVDPAGGQVMHVSHVMILKVNPNLPFALAKNFTVAVKIGAWYQHPLTDPADTEKTLVVNYSDKGTYNSKDEWVKEDIPAVTYKIMSVTITDANNNTVTITDTNKGLIVFKQQLQYDRYLKPDPTDKIKLQHIKITTDNGYAVLDWANIPWARAYDIEYAFADNYTDNIAQFLSPAQVGYNFRFNSTRIRLTATSYKIPIVYENGFLLFRVRPVGFAGNQNNIPVTGKWSTDESGDKLTEQTVGAEGAFFCKISGSTVHENDKKNWQHIAVFSSNGKRKDSVFYSDGTLRTRQTVSAFSSQNNLLVSETIYDNSGRAAIQVLPAPVFPTDLSFGDLPKIAYQDKFNTNTGGTDYNWQNFDKNKQPNDCVTAPDPLANTSGAGKYYSTANDLWNLSSPGIKRQLAYVPDAGGYPFSQTEFTPDGTGRILSISGPGAVHRLGGGHGIKFYYGNPSQDELDEFFGSDVGTASHYTKEVRVNENNQAHIIIKDLSGHTILSGLTGKTQANLDPVTTASGHDIIVNLIDDGNRPNAANNAIESTQSVVIAEPTDLNLYYNLQPRKYNDTVCTKNDKLCYDCIYNLSISVTDACHTKLLDTMVHIGTLNELRSCELNPAEQNIKKKWRVGPGVYTVTKVLAVDEHAVEAYISDFLNDPCWNTVQPDTSQSVPVKTCIIADTAIRQNCENDTAKQTINPLIRYLPVIKPCTEGCILRPGSDYLSLVLQKMLADLSPGGQYAQCPGCGVNGMLPNITDYPLSVLNAYNKLPSKGNWMHPIIEYRNEDGSPILIDVVINGARKKLKPEGLSFQLFLQYWKPSMAYSLLPYHPEYCTYEWAAGHRAFFAYQDSLMAIDIFKQAQTKFPGLTPGTGKSIDITKDPLFDTTDTEGLRRWTEMTKYLSDVNALLNPRVPSPPLTISEFAELAAAGFSAGRKSDDLLRQYLKTHQLFGKNVDSDEQWQYIKIAYLAARAKVLDNAIQSTESCCRVEKYIGTQDCFSGFSKSPCVSYADKIPVFANTDQIRRLALAKNELASAINPNGPPPCLNCDGPQTMLSFFNTMAVKKQLSGTFPLNGRILAAIGNRQTDAAIAAGDGITWTSTISAAVLNASIADAKTSQKIIDLTLTGEDPLNWQKVIAFTCLKATGPPSNFTLMVTDAGGKQFTIQGKILTGLAVTNCTGLTNPGDQTTASAVNPVFLRMLQQVLKSANAGSIPAQQVFGGTADQNTDPGPISIWYVPTTSYTTSPLVLEAEVPQPDHANKLMDITVQFNDISEINDFRDWIIDGYELVSPATVPSDCADINTIKLRIKDQAGTKKDIIIISTMDFSFGKACKSASGPSLCCMPVMPQNSSLPAEDPAAMARTRYLNSELQRIDQLKHQRAAVLRQQYIDHCLRPIEIFTADFDENIYQATLSYYDQAGNLTKTISPRDVDTLTAAQLKQIRDDRLAGKISAVVTHHVNPTSYTYNSANSLITSNSPNSGLTRYCYDEYGRVIYQQAAAQHNDHHRTSFIKYDPSGRIVQSGEIIPDEDPVVPRLLYRNFEKHLAISNYDKSDVINSYYDDLPLKYQFNGFDQNLNHFKLENLRNRVAITVYNEDLKVKIPYTQAYFYSYDVRGHVTKLYQDFRYLTTLQNGHLEQRLKKTLYTYDLFTDKVSMVWYQPGQADEFVSRYSYDGAYRLENVRTSRRKWEPIDEMDLDAHYQYYPHGPLARIELGQEKIQGVDYIYTIGGQLKAMNGTPLNSGTGIGDDGKVFLSDVASFALSYCPGDYTPVGKQPFMPDLTGSLLSGGSDNSYAAPQYNDNISSMITTIPANGSSPDHSIQYNAYRYDALNRLAGMKLFKPAGTWPNGTMGDDYLNTYIFDGNGNFSKLVRNDQNGKLIDNLNYTYGAADRLDHIVNTAATTSNQLTQYEYDTSGRLTSEIQNNSSWVYTWNSFNKPANIKKDDFNEQFTYNALTQRAFKYNEQNNTFTYYTRDLQGNVFAIYTFTPNSAKLDQIPLYGASRLGTEAIGLDLTKSFDPDEMISARGTKGYEITDNLGGVLATVSDRRLLQSNGWTADITSAQNYYPFGMPEPGVATGAYRYGYNGKEKDNEIFGDGNAYDYGSRFYDPRIGRWLSADPLAGRYPSFSPYNYSLNNPINTFDPDGAAPVLFLPLNIENSLPKGEPSDLDATIAMQVAIFNYLRKAGQLSLPTEGEKIPSSVITDNVKELNPTALKAQIMVESTLGNLAPIDVMQFDNKGDANGTMRSLKDRLLDGAEMSPDVSINAGIRLTAIKGFRDGIKYDSNGHLTYSWKGWDKAMFNYNGKGDPLYMQKFNCFLEEFNGSGNTSCPPTATPSPSHSPSPSSSPSPTDPQPARTPIPK